MNTPENNQVADLKQVRMHFHTVHNHTVKLIATGRYGGQKDKHMQTKLNKLMEYNYINNSDSTGSEHSCITYCCKLGGYNNERMNLYWPFSLNFW